MKCHMFGPLISLLSFSTKMSIAITGFKTSTNCAKKKSKVKLILETVIIFLKRFSLNDRLISNILLLHLKLVSWRCSIRKSVNVITLSRNCKVFFWSNINTHPKIGDPKSRIFKVDNSWGNIYIHFCNLDLKVDLDQLFMKLNLVTTFSFSQIIVVTWTKLGLLLRNTKFVVPKYYSNGRLSGR